MLAPGTGAYAKNVLANVVGWPRGHPRQADALLAAALLAFSVSQVAAGPATPTMRAVFFAVTALLAATVVSRRR